MTEDMTVLVGTYLSINGSVDEALETPLRTACEQALLSRLKPGVNPETDCPEVFALAVALLMLAEADTVQAGGSAASFTAGSLTISRSAGETDDSASLRARAYTLLRPYLTDEGFAFRSVRA